MKKQSVIVLSSIIASVLLVGATFAAYAVTDNADPFGINVTPGTVEEDTTTKYVTLKWGESTSLNTIENAKAGGIYKLGVISLESTREYRGVFTVTLTDKTSARPLGQEKFIDYLKMYLYDGPTTGVEADSLPEATPLASTPKGGTLLQYNNATGTTSGKEYSLYIEVDSSIKHLITLMGSDVVDIEIDWKPQLLSLYMGC